MDLIDRYVYAVTKSLPERQRKDIEKEIRALIDDMVEQADDSESYETKVQRVLEELGNPEILADNYRGSGRYVIGPLYYDKYIFILKIVFMAVFIGVTIAFLVNIITGVQQDVPDRIAGYLTAVISGLLQAFAFITIVFGIAERKSIDIFKQTSKKNSWSPSQLPPVPDRKAMIPLQDPVISIFLTAIFISIFYFAPEIFAYKIHNGNGNILLPIFRLEVLQEYRVIFLLIFLLSMSKEILKIYFRRWTLKLSIITAVLSFLSTASALALFANNSIWNSDFPNEIVKYINISFDFAQIWAGLKTGFVVVIALAGLVDVLTILIKGFKYDAVK